MSAPCGALISFVEMMLLIRRPAGGRAGLQSISTWPNTASSSPDFG